MNRTGVETCRVANKYFVQTEDLKENEGKDHQYKWFLYKNAFHDNDNNISVC